LQEQTFTALLAELQDREENEEDSKEEGGEGEEKREGEKDEGEEELLPERRTDSRQLRLNHASFVFDCDRMGWLNSIIRETSTLYATLSHNTYAFLFVRLPMHKLHRSWVRSVGTMESEGWQMKQC
jgi:hypothetical protein